MSKIIKHTIPAEQRVISRQSLGAREEAQEIVREAQRQAEQIQQAAQRLRDQAVEALEEARRQGFAEGEARGLAQVTERLVQLDQIKERFYQQAESEVIRLVMDIAEKVIGQIVDQHVDAIRSIVHQALERAIGERIVVRVNPEDYAAVAEPEGQFRDVVDRTRRLLFRSDDSIAKGGCVVETEVGTIDAQLETQLRAIRQALGL